MRVPEGKEPKQRKPEDIHVWLQCFAMYVGEMATKHPE